MKVYRLDDNTELSEAELKKTGVLTWQFDPNNYKEQLDAIRKERGYNYEDTCTINRDALPDYDNKLKIFFTEHIHTDEEIRFFLEGTGYFDVRGLGDEWIRIHAVAGTLIVLPAGIYHRYSPDDKNYSKVLRLFCGEPIWTPFNRGEETDSMQARQEYNKALAA